MAVLFSPVALLFAPMASLSPVLALLPDPMAVPLPPAALLPDPMAVPLPPAALLPAPMAVLLLLLATLLFPMAVLLPPVALLPDPLARSPVVEFCCVMPVEPVPPVTAQAITGVTAGSKKLIATSMGFRGLSFCIGIKSPPSPWPALVLSPDFPSDRLLPSSDVTCSFPVLQFHITL